MDCKQPTELDLMRSELDAMQNEIARLKCLLGAKLGQIQTGIGELHRQRADDDEIISDQIQHLQARVLELEDGV